MVVPPDLIQSIFLFDLSNTDSSFAEFTVEVH